MINILLAEVAMLVMVVAALYNKLTDTKHQLNKAITNLCDEVEKLRFMVSHSGIKNKGDD